ncbi:hypothetical protein M409DRAFT_49133 [Zasmidium cellare ATCC 36951]|uniref:DUF1254 domain-containing protein n=1 Tax=Zasmidium cellare ATCC 36951 TaxID=1080233 RepID=A0A6A6D5E2_ZASCE|nr:uncharacterized protein M409DRAFT_49133 [Zasmidium cellare ATCC 36951]KAF2174275.1 hypothetical protein M409DRAFT_49133 [Zasmidium cellare ATCC 36951]
MRLWLNGLQLASFAALSACAEAINVQDATAFALTYGYPLVVFEGHVQDFNTTGPNKFKHVQITCTPTLCPNTIRPDIDTLYSQMVWDLSSNDVAVGLPRGIPQDQFVLFSFFDPYGDNFANFGSEHIRTPGEYFLRRSVRGPFDVTKCVAQKQYQACINAPSTYGYLIARWLVSDTNIEQIRECAENVALDVLNLLAKFAQFTTPTNTSDTMRVDQTLDAAGTRRGQFVQRPGVDIHKANEAAQAAAAAAAAAGSSPASNEKLSNG